MLRRIGLYPGGNINISSENEGTGDKVLEIDGKLVVWHPEINQDHPRCCLLRVRGTFFNPFVISFDLEKNIDC